MLACFAAYLSTWGLCRAGNFFGLRGKTFGLHCSLPQEHEVKHDLIDEDERLA